MKRKQKISIILAILSMIIGIVIISLPILKLVNFKRTIFLSFLTIGIFNLVCFIYTHKDKDLESLYTFIACTLIAVLSLFLNFKKSINSALVLMLFVALLSFVRLKKADYYHDRKNKAWIIQMVTLSIFVLAGLLSSLNLYYTSEIKVLVFGYFFFINGILELVDPLILYLENLNENRK